MIKDFYVEQDVHAEFLKRFKYRRFEVDPNMVLRIHPDWTGFDDYLQAMTSKYRSRAKSVIKKSRGLERCDWSAADIAANAERIDALYRAVHHKASFRICEVNHLYIFECKKRLGDNFRCMVYKLDGKVLAFFCLVKWGQHLEAHTIGMDYEYNNQYALYQNILYDSVRYAVEWGCTDIIYGRTALEMKSSIGAEAQPMSCYLRHKGPVRNRLIKPIFAYLKPSTWTERSPFKEQDS